MFQVLILLVTPVLVGVLIGYAAGGRLANLLSLRLRALWLLWLAGAVQAAQYYLPWLRRLVQDNLGIPMLAVVFAIVLMWITLNLLRWPRLMRLAAALIVAGAIGNGLVIAAGRRPSAPARHRGRPQEPACRRRHPACLSWRRHPAGAAWQGPQRW